MSGLACEKCGAPMALADARCNACGAPAPLGRAGMVFKQRAEAAQEAGNMPEAVRHMFKALELGLGLAEGEMALAYRKLGIWQEKLGQHAGASESFKKAVELADGDDTAHHLWMDSLSRQGRGSEAKKWYQERLAANPEDAVAARQIKVMALAVDFQTAPRPVMADLGPATRIEKWLYPSPWKVITLVFQIASALGMAVVAATQGGGEPMAEGPKNLENLDIVSMIVGDVWTWIFTAGFCSVLLLVMYRVGRK